MAKETFTKKLQRLAEEKSHKETRIKACKELISLQRKLIASMEPENVSQWRTDDYRMRACSCKRQAVQIEAILRGAEAAKQLDIKLRSKVPSILPLTVEQKAEQAAIPIPAPTGYTGYYSPRADSKQRALFDSKGRVHWERDS